MAAKKLPRSKVGHHAAEPAEPEVIDERPLTKHEPREEAFAFEIDPKRVEDSLNRLSEQIVKLAKKGRYTKVRFKFRGKQLLPDIPFAAVAAVEGLSFYWAGLLRLLVFNLAGKAMLEVELVNDSEKKMQLGKEALLSGDLDRALALFTEAADMDHDNPQVHLNLGVAHKLNGHHDAARKALTLSMELDPTGPTGAEAARLRSTLKPAAR